MLSSRWGSLPEDPARLAEVMAAHDEAVRRGEDGYFDPHSEWFVFTSAALARRPCCSNDCRHCPYRQ